MSCLNKSIEEEKRNVFRTMEISAGGQSGPENSRQGLHHQVSPSAPNVVSVTTGGVKGLENKKLKAIRTTQTP